MRAVGTGHHDALTDIAYDFYGRRMATCAVDHTIKVFDRSSESGEWVLNDSWRAHEAAVIKLSWAGPQHAQTLASASHDCTVKIWEENVDESLQSGKRWRRRYTISDFKGPLYSVAFAPSVNGLKLAAIAADGVLRIYEALDPNNLGYWTTVAETPLLNHPVARQLQSSFALAWSPSLAYEDWLAVCVLEDAVIFRRDKAGNRYTRVAELQQHRGLIRDIAWAPSLGRSYCLIATACKDGFVRIFRLESQGEDPEQIDLKLVHESADHGGEVWRVSWNPSGTILASAGDDAKIRFWKSLYTGPFQCMVVVDGDPNTHNTANA